MMMLRQLTSSRSNARLPFAAALGFFAASCSAFALTPTSPRPRSEKDHHLYHASGATSTITQHTTRSHYSKIHPFGLSPLWAIQRSQCEAAAVSLEKDDDDNDADDILSAFGFSPSQTKMFRPIPIPKRAEFENHAIFGTLMGRPGLVEQYRVFRHLGYRDDHDERTVDNQNHPNETTMNSNTIVLAAIKLGPSLNGHDGIVHGGIIALLMDDLMGFAYEALPRPPRMAVTANLNINFRAPLPANTQFLIQVACTERVGRKLLFDVKVTSPDQSILYCEATSIFVVPKQHAG